MKKTIIIGLMVIILAVLISNTNVLAGYTTEQNAKTAMYDNVIHFTDSCELVNTEETKYLKVHSMNDLKNNFRNNSVVLIENDMTEKLDFEWIKKILKENNVIVLVGYNDLTEEISKHENRIDLQDINNTYARNSEKLNRFINNGYYKVTLDNQNLAYGNFLVKAHNVDQLLEYVNVNEGKLEITNKKDEKTSIIEDVIETRTATNHPIRFYWADNTIDNKIYSQPIGTEEYIRIHLYKGEIIYELGGDYEYTYSTSSTRYLWSFTKVHGLNMYGQYITGYMVKSKCGEHLYEADGWFSMDYGFNQSLPLWKVIDRGLKSGSTVAPDHFATRIVNGTTYYGTRIRTATALYNGSGTYIQSAPVGSWVWTSESQNMCGASNHHYMSINGYSSSKNSTMTVFNATTFVDAGFNTNTPLNYKITTRWWE